MAPKLPSPPRTANKDRQSYQLQAAASFTPQFQEKVAELTQTDFHIQAEAAIYTPKSRFDRLNKWLKIFLVLLPALWIYEQYLEQSNRTRIDQADQELRVATEQLTSTSPSIRASGVRSLYNLAFKELPVEPSSNWYAPIVNLLKWVSGQRERRLLEQSRNLFREFAATPRIPVEDDEKNVVSTAIIKVSIEWVAREQSLLGKSSQDPTLWFLYRAKLGKAYAPGSHLEGIQFYDADLSNAILNSSNLSNAYMEGSNLKASDLESCLFVNSNLIKANLENAKLNYSKFDGAKLQKANLAHADLTLARLTQADLTGATLFQAILRTSDLQQATFRDADLRETNFSQANIRGADFERADLRGADLRFATGITEVKSWLGAKVDGTKFPDNFSPLSKETKQ